MLAIIQVGHNPASDLYIRNKQRDIGKNGLESKLINIGEDVATTEMLIQKINELAKDENVSSIMVQLPLPESIDEKEVLCAIPPKMDIDGLNPKSDYVPLTPSAIMRWINTNYGTDYLKGKTVTLLGRSNLVGLPLSVLLIKAGATLLSCNSNTSTETKEKLCKMSDVIISAVGKIGVVNDSCVGVEAPPRLVIDVGINRDPVTKKMCGDVLASTRGLVNDSGGCCPPVPGSVGKWTVNELVIRLGEMEANLK